MLVLGEGFAYPNELEVGWSLLVVLYPFTTGLIAGAFIVSALYYVFNVTSLRPLARFSLVTALAFVLVAPLPLQAHLGRPERAMEIFLLPNFGSAMAIFGYVWVFYLIIVSIQTWLVFREDIVRYAQTTQGIKKRIYSLLTLGVYDISERSLRIDRKVVKILGAIGIPSAWILFHGYSGFLFGVVKANPWWSTPLMPIIFLFSAVVSGMALLIVLYVATMAAQGRPIHHAAVRSLSGWLAGFLAVNLTVEGLEIVSMMYKREESWEIVRQLITERLMFSYVGLQMVIGSVIPLAILATIALTQLGRRLTTTLATFSGALVLVGVFAMRWNVVIGGQMLSKSLRGFLSYTPDIGGREGILAALLVMSLPFWLFGIITYFIPPWREAMGKPELEPEPATAEVGKVRPKPQELPDVEAI